MVQCALIAHSRPLKIYNMRESGSQGIGVLLNNQHGFKHHSSTECRLGFSDNQSYGFRDYSIHLRLWNFTNIAKNSIQISVKINQEPILFYIFKPNAIFFKCMNAYWWSWICIRSFAFLLFPWSNTYDISYNKRQNSRIYPRGNRVDSSNYMPQVSLVLFFVDFCLCNCLSNATLNYTNLGWVDHCSFIDDFG